MPTYYEFEASLTDIQPRIWRRFLLDADATFRDLHLAIQDAGPWGNYHLFAFRKKARSRQAIATNAGRDFGPDARKVPLKPYFTRRRDQCIYEYDFGDSWMHRVRLKAVRDLPERFHRRLLDGKRAFPMEDSGSIPGYYACAAAAGAVDAEALDLPEEFVEEKSEWMDPDWHPDAFDLETARQAFDLDRPPDPSSAEAPFEADDEGDIFGLLDDEEDWEEPFGFDAEADEEAGFPFGLDDLDLRALLEGAFRVPAGYPVPISMPQEMRTLLLPVASGHERVASAIRNARPDSPMVDMPLQDVEELIALIRATMSEAESGTRTRLQAAAEHLSSGMLPYVETEDIASIGLPAEETADSPLEDTILMVENSLLNHWGLIDEAELARRTGRTLADIGDEAGVRLTRPQREAILENVALSEALRQRLTVDSPRIATVQAPLGDLGELHDDLQDAVEEATGNLKGKLQRALDRLRETLEAYVVREPAGPPGNGDGA